MAKREHPRRIVTGIREDGTSYIARIDELTETSFRPTGSTPAEVRMLEVGYPRWNEGEIPGVLDVWGCEELPFTLPADPDATPSCAITGALSARASISVYPPGWEGLFIWANRVDILWILRGQLTYTTDGGDSVVAEPGDIVIQNGVNIAFANRGTEDVWMGAVMFPARRAPGPAPPPERFSGLQSLDA